MSDPSTRQLIVSASGVRGVVGSALTPEVVARYGAAFGSFLRAVEPPAEDLVEGGRGAPQPGWVLLARDSRTTGGLLADAAAAGLRATGWDVRDAGVVPTPTALLAVQDESEARGALIVTASHNPVEWNGLKLASSDGEFVSSADGEEVQALFEGGDPTYAGWDGVGGRSAYSDAGIHHVGRILGLGILDPVRVQEAGLTVALDAVRGAAGPVLVLLLERMGCRVEGVDLEPDGRFPRPPEPRPEHLGELGRKVAETGADVGMAVDPDGDRLALVDETGEPVGEDWTLALAAEYVLARRSGPLVTNLSSSRVIADVAERRSVPFHLAPVGEAAVAARMREVSAVVGGEGNGGVMLPELHLTRDGPLAAALVLALLSETGKPLSGLVSERPAYHISKRRAPRAEGSLEELYADLEGGAPEGWRADRQDGLRLDWPSERRWLHVRPSGTEPVLRIVAEAPEEDEADGLASWAVEIAEEHAESG